LDNEIADDEFRIPMDSPRLKPTASTESEIIHFFIIKLHCILIPGFARRKSIDRFLLLAQKNQRRA
jgi:hypothetical protein